MQPTGPIWIYFERGWASIYLHIDQRWQIGPGTTRALLLPISGAYARPLSYEPRAASIRKKTPHFCSRMILLHRPPPSPPPCCLLHRAGIFKKSMGARHLGGIGFSYRPARLHRLTEFIPWNQFRTAKTKCRKFETNIPRKGISGPQSQFTHSYVCERIIYPHDGSACSAGGNM
jgi:hypothetical protein